MLWCPRKTTTVSEPQSFNQANKSVEWRAAIQDEFDALISNRTLSLVPKPPEANAVGNKWSYRIKRSADGRVKRFKGSIGCKGFHTTILYIFHWKFQSNREIYHNSNCTSISSIKWIDFKALDVSNAFLHGTITEEVYMT